MEAIKKMSYSSSKVLKNCEQEFAHYKIYNTPPDSDYEESDALGFGKAFHQTLEVSLHNNFVKEVCMEAMVEHKVHEADLGLLLAMGKRYVKLHKLSKLKAVKCELKLETPEYIGFIDVILVADNGEWWLGDLKTTSRFDQNLLARLPKDDQMNVYSHFAEWIAPQFGLDVEKFRGCRYRAVTKPKIVQKGKETPEEYAERVAEKVEVYDIEIPIEMMNPKAAWNSILESHARSLELQQGEAPKRNYNGCISYFKPCRYFSQCHGSLFSESAGKVKVHTIESFEGAESL